MPQADPFADFLARWDLTPDGTPVATPTSRLLPVRRRGGSPAMLKIAVEAEERRGNLLMAWWDGDGAAPALAHDGAAILLERANSQASLVEMARGGRDDEASRTICAVAARLHQTRGAPPPALMPLSCWFAALWPAADHHGGMLAQAAATARELLETPRDIVALHGDLHHANILHFGSRGWLAIDPKGLVGERGFDFANILRNPDRETATAPGRLGRQAGIVAASAGLDPVRLLKWTLALAGLSSAWLIAEGWHPELDLAVAEIVAAELNRA